ncbi:hypothetical protein [Sporosarcina limicola]|uniref:Secreted protein n=1 Tax=Sporosarcina limicola TaxID=34101 RepID=A0A927RG19_9BACL|nr:hypothetical protein [Sporosarcina limicola]MBE1556097.1 hypothetical protein [Sporosarcina limicola]
MKTKMFLPLLFGMFLMIFPTIGFAQGNENLNELPFEETNSFYEETVNPMWIPCPYWESDHRWQTGNVTTGHVTEYHTHRIAGVDFKNCEWKQWTRYTEQYCACGKYRTLQQYIGPSNDKHTYN